MAGDGLVSLIRDLVMAQASHVAMSAEEVARAIKEVCKAFNWVEVQEERAQELAKESAISGVDSIGRSRLICLECGR
jgi:predicted transcriptional regulator